MVQRSDLDLSTLAPWLKRWKGSQRIVGLPCFLPGCRRTVERAQGAGRRRLYCSDKHRLEAHSRRGDLMDAAGAIRSELAKPAAQTRGFDRDQARSDLKYLETCLAAYRAPLPQ